MSAGGGRVFTADRRKLRGLVFVIAAFSLAFASRGLFDSYSYWLDELSSVSASMDTWENLYNKWILPDVHPPLFQLLLKPWIALLGTSENATRLLSFLFSGITMSIFSLEALRRGEPRRLLALLLIGIRPSFAYYAQETRSYGMVLMLASLVTILAIRLQGQDVAVHKGNQAGRWRDLSGYYAASIALALAHYFGWIYVFVLSLINLVRPTTGAGNRRTLALIAVISIWPAWHVFVGGLASNSGGSFWIKVRPIVGTIQAYLQGCLPPLAPSGSPYNFLFAWILLACVVLMAFGSLGSIKEFVLGSHRFQGAFATESRFLAFAIVGDAFNHLFD